MYNQKITGIMACDPHGTIALNKRLPWHYPEETEFYRTTIAQQTIVLGYSTFIEMPAGFFENHLAIVFSQQKNRTPQKNVIFVASIEEFKQIKLPLKKACYMIGGAEIANLFLTNNLLEDFLLTRITKEYSGDRFFPLELIKTWPKSVIKANKDFIIYHYFNPRSGL